MLPLIAAWVGTFLLLLISTSTFGGAIRCEDRFEEIRAVQASTPLTDEEKARVLALIRNALERCTADDDERADQLFAEALSLMRK
jgi:hypothetical protein